jgi:superoxide dismutase, Fe-Mn family
MIFKRIKLPYKLNEFDGILSEELMDIHYNRHHALYESSLNKELEKYQLNPLIKTEEDLIIYYKKYLPKELHYAVNFFGGGLINHNFFFKLLSKNNPLENYPKIKEVIINNFNNLENFYNKLINSGKNIKVNSQIQGSGWVWVVLDRENKLQIYSTSNQENPLQYKLKPILGIDMWEHAYYLVYKNDKLTYLKNLLKIINWQQVEKNYNKYLSFNFEN